MVPNERKLTFASYVIPSRRCILEAECRRRCLTLAGREASLLPEGWTDEDAWQLAGTLAKRMAHAKWYCAALYTDDTFPAEDAPLADIPACDGIAVGQGAEPEPFPLDLCTEVLHCGILAAAGAPRPLLPFKGTFGALEELFTGTVMTDSGPMLRFEAMLRLLPLTASWEELREKGMKSSGQSESGEWNFQEMMENREMLHLWRWLEGFPYRDALLQAVGRLKSGERFRQVTAFVRSNMAGMERISALHHGTGADGLGYSGFLKEAIDLYLYQIGAHNLLDWQTVANKNDTEDNFNGMKGDN